MFLLMDRVNIDTEHHNAPSLVPVLCHLIFKTVFHSDFPASHCCPSFNIFATDDESDLFDVQGFELGTYNVNGMSELSSSNLTYYTYIEDVIEGHQSVLGYK